MLIAVKYFFLRLYHRFFLKTECVKITLFDKLKLNYGYIMLQPNDVELQYLGNDYFLILRHKNIIKGDFIWQDENKNKAVWEPNSQGRFIMGCDPYYIPRWWEKILIWLHVIKDKSSNVTFTKLPKDYVDMKNIKIKKDADNKN